MYTSDGRHAICTREEEGSLREVEDAGGWLHRLDPRNGRPQRVDSTWLEELVRRAEATDPAELLVELELAQQEHRDTNVEVYGYRDTDRNVLREKIRYPDGQKRWRRAGPKVNVPYCLPELIAAAKRGERIYIVDGERDVLALRQRGYAATCAPNGMSSWRGEYNGHLEGASEVVIVRDRDGEVRGKR